MQDSNLGLQDFKPKPLGHSVSFKSLALPVYTGSCTLRISVILRPSRARGVPRISDVLFANTVWVLKQLSAKEENTWLLQNSLISSGVADSPGCNLKKKSCVVKTVALRN